MIHEMTVTKLVCDQCLGEITQGQTMSIVVAGTFDGYLRNVTAEALIGAWEPHLSSPERTDLVPRHFHEACMP